VVIRYDPLDMAEIRIFHHHRFLCRAICAELAGDTIALRDIIRARNRRRRDLRQTLQDRARTVEVLLEAHRGDAAIDEPSLTDRVDSTPDASPKRLETPRLKRYFND
jgi:putative transposase